MLCFDSSCSLIQVAKLTLSTPILRVFANQTRPTICGYHSFSNICRLLAPFRRQVDSVHESVAEEPRTRPNPGVLPEAASTPTSPTRTPQRAPAMPYAPRTFMFQKTGPRHGDHGRARVKLTSGIGLSLQSIGRVQKPQITPAGTDRICQKRSVTLSITLFRLSRSRQIPIKTAPSI